MLPELTLCVGPCPLEGIAVWLEVCPLLPLCHPHPESAEQLGARSLQPTPSPPTRGLGAKHAAAHSPLSVTPREQNEDQEFKAWKEV